MSKIVVAKLVRLGKDGDNFSKDLIAKVERTNAKVDDDYIKEVNANYKTTGRLYVVDEEATEERDSKLNGSLNEEDEKIRSEYKELFGKLPDKRMKIETVRLKIDEKLNS